MTTKPLRKKPHRFLANSNPTNPQNSPSLSKCRMKALLISAVGVVCFLVLYCTSSKTEPGFYNVEVVNEFPHDPDAFTQGLVYAGNDDLFESTGLYGHSSIRKVSIRTGKVEAIHKMENSYFGEGLTLIGNRLFQVNWMTKTGFIYDRNNLSKSKMFTNKMKDGWGLATNGKVIFGSDGTSTLYHIAPRTMTVFNKYTVKYRGDEVHNLNELEYVDGEIWANVWQTDCIARLSDNGYLLGWIYLPNLREGLLASGNKRIDVLNGIAWDPEHNRIFVTGKLWPRLYEIKLHRVKEPPSEGDIKGLCMPPPVQFGKP